ncbi:MAG TPA: low affinity iron permease family protein [Bryobacteraceae bacterium]|nr:low affinity iron permease family protein [Bryobacteraceae bacterium]
MREAFRRFACRTADACGSPGSFALGVGVILVWALTGPYFHYSDTWQLIINTGTTIVTFLMVFLIQNTQNRDAKAMQLKLDELIRAVSRARNELVDLENSDDEKIAQLTKEFSSIREKLDKPKAGEAVVDQTT